MTDILLINDASTSPNWGDRAAATALKMMASQSGGTIIKTITEDDVLSSSLDGHPAAVGVASHDARSIVKRFLPPIVLDVRRSLLSYVGESRLNRLMPRSLKEYDGAADRLLGSDSPWPQLLKTMKAVDVIMLNGAGSIYGNGVPPRTMLFLGYVAKRYLTKSVIMVNHTADFDHPDLLEVAHKVYPLFDDVVFRDAISVERCRTICDGRFAADTAFWFEPAKLEDWGAVGRRPTYFDLWPDTASFDPCEPYVCIGGSSLFASVRDRAAIIGAYRMLVEQLRSTYSGQIVLTASDPVDQAIFHPMSVEAGLPLISVATPVQQAVDIVGNADAYIGGRWHVGIFALRGGTPVLALSAKTFKMRALMEMAGLPPATFDALELAEGRRGVVEQLVSYLEQGMELRTRLRAWAQQQADDSWENVTYLKDHETPPRPAVGGAGPSVKGER